VSAIERSLNLFIPSLFPPSMKFTTQKGYTYQ